MHLEPVSCRPGWSGTAVQTRSAESLQGALGLPSAGTWLLFLAFLFFFFFSFSYFLGHEAERHNALYFLVKFALPQGLEKVTSVAGGTPQPSLLVSRHQTKASLIKDI